ncbi:MAG: T9SS type A sorting domain-containing protein [Candidatus Krumholzibacteria bacterium]|nr:T9SS type A sorting domain-containing protein [Candidatus Krumholzibacteria bacterium]
MSSKFLFRAIGLAILILSSNLAAQECPEESPLKNYTGTGSIVCPCFVAGEEAGAVLNAPAEHYPIQVLRIGLGWSSQFGGAPRQVEEAIHIYEAGLPNPGARLYSLEGPYLTDGAINEFNLESQLGKVIVDSGPFTVTLQFFNTNAGDPFAPSMVHDGNGCQTGKNVIYAIPDGWMNACAAGATGDWILYAVYRRVNCTTGTDEEYIASNRVPAFLWNAQPNPFSSSTRIDFFLSKEAKIRVDVYDIRGSKVATLADSNFPPGKHSIMWEGRSPNSARLASGVYFVELRRDDFKTVKKVIIAR